jgi:hypothetical protein
VKLAIVALILAYQMGYWEANEKYKLTGESAIRSKMMVFVLLLGSALNLWAQEQRSTEIQG